MLDHDQHLESCPLTHHVTEDVGSDRRISRSVGRVYARSEVRPHRLGYVPLTRHGQNPPPPDQCPFEIRVAGRRAVYLCERRPPASRLTAWRRRPLSDCFHHTRTFLAFMPEQTVHLVVNSALEIRCKPDPVLDLHVCTRGVYERLLRTVDEAKSGTGRGFLAHP
jgi:hypothetical protein